MRALPPLGGLRAFEVAARKESFKLAAAELGVTPTAISHQIRQIEDSLGVALFLRQTRKVTLTEEGKHLYPALRDAFDAMAVAIKSLKKKPRRRVATLSATVAFTAKRLVPRAADFRDYNSGWDLRLHASDEMVDLHGNEADAAIRYGLGRYPGLVSVPLLSDTFAPMCSPHFKGQTIEALPASTLIHFDWGAGPVRYNVPTWRTWARTAGLAAQIDQAGKISFNDESSAIQAAIAGQGVALLSRALVAQELASGTLVEPFGPTLEGLRYDFVYPIAAETDPAVAALHTWVTTLFPKPSVK